MPIAKIQLPDGRIARFEVPEGTTPEQVTAFAQKQFAAPAQPAPRDIDAERKQAASGGQLLIGPFNTGIDIPQGVVETLAGAGRRMMDIATLGNRKAAPEADQLLDQSGYATAGSVGADLVTALAGGRLLSAGGQALSAALPRAGAALQSAGTALSTPTTIPQAAAGGAIYGAATTNGGLPERALAAGAGALGGTAGQVIPRVGAAAYQGVRGLVTPFTAAGQEEIAARALQRFAENPQAAAAAARQAGELVPGSLPSMAEATGDIGLAQLQRTLSNNPEVGNALARRSANNSAARIAALRGISGTDEALEAAVGARQGAAQALYGQAFESDAMRREVTQRAATEAAALRAARMGRGAANLPEAARESILPSDALRALNSRPAFAQAVALAQNLARNRGEDIGNPLTSLRGLHYVKLAIDDMLETTPTNALSRNASAGLADMQTRLVSEIQQLSPLYGNARRTYQQMSAPVNQMQVGQALQNRLQTALQEAGGADANSAAMFAGAVRNGDQLARRATGYGRATLDNTLTPEQLQIVEAIVADLGRKAASETSGKAVGSNTAQNLVSQNLLRQILGPTGLPENWAEGALLQTIARPIQFGARLIEPRVMNRLSEAALDPQEAARLLAMRFQQNPLLNPANTAPFISSPLGALSVNAAQQ